MAKRKKPLPEVAERTVTNGYVYACDENGRPCLDLNQRERVVITNDLRAYSPDLFAGALGWTNPKDSDGYKFAGIEFDNGAYFRLKKYAFEQIELGAADEIAAEIVERNRGTRFDKDAEIAESLRREWIRESYGKHLSLAETYYDGEGDQEVYGFTFPSLVELSELKGIDTYPVKIGHSQNTFDGAIGRIRSEITDTAGYPEKPIVLFVLKTWTSRKIETLMHKWLRSKQRKVTTSLGNEWFLTSRQELLEYLPSVPQTKFDPERIICGADETIDETFGALADEGYTMEAKMDPDSASVAISIRPPGIA